MEFKVDLSKKVAMVTGASGGIGRAIGFALAGAGAKVLVNDILKDELESVARSIREKKYECQAYPADIAVKEQVEGLIKETVRAFGRIDLLVNCAGILRIAPFLEYREEDWDATIAINLKGTFLCSQSAARQMIKQGVGKIINIASNAGKRALVNNAAYCASKAGVILLTRVMALELARFNITVNALCPGATATEMLTKVQGRDDPKVLEGIIRGDLNTYRSGIPMGRLAKPEEQAAMVMYLASDYANHITGQTFVVDGGQTMV